MPRLSVHSSVTVTLKVETSSHWAVATTVEQIRTQSISEIEGLIRKVFEAEPKKPVIVGDMKVKAMIIDLEDTLK